MTWPSRLNWTSIINACPEFYPNESDVILAVIAFAGLVMSLILMCRFHKERRHGAAFLDNLAACDFAMCFMYLWQYTGTSAIMYYRLNLLGKLRIELQNGTNMLKHFYELCMTLIMCQIIIERYLWTCSSRTRLTWSYFTMGAHKFYMLLITVSYALVDVFITFFNRVEFSKVPFCDIALRAVAFEHPFFRFLQLKAFPWVHATTTLLTFVLALLTLCRVPLVGEGEKPVNQIDGVLGDRPRLTTGRIKRSIMCMLAVYMCFMIRGFSYYLYVDPETSNMFTGNLSSRILKSWSYDFMNVVFSGSRLIIYYAFCRNEMVIEFPPNALGN